MKISIITPDMSMNALARAYLLARILQRRFEIELIGPIFGSEVWKPLQGLHNINYRTIRIKGRFKPYIQLWQLSEMITGDVIYASKPLLSSYGVGLVHKLLHRKPLVLDIDDWETGLRMKRVMKSGLAQHLKDRILSLLFIYSIGSSLNAALGERLSIFADAVTVSGSFLQSLFGGTIIPHAKDTMLLDPAAFNPTRLREAYGIHPDARVVMFLGSPGEHKGLDSLIEAVHELKDPNVMLFIVGIDESSPYCRHILEKAPRALGGNFVGIRMQPVDKIPEFIAMADVMAIPQKISPASIGQVPSKVFDAMAMARPIVATSVSDLPEILNGCGWIVPPDNTRALAEALRHVLSNPREAQEKGLLARKKCIEKYGFDSVEKELFDVFRKFTRLG